MALIKCPKCGREISDKAINCVGCGWGVERVKESKKEKITKLQHTVGMKREKSFPSANILFMTILTLVMICFMIIVWIRLDKFAAEIDIMASNNQIDSEMATNDIENESVEDIEENENQGDLEDSNEKEEISDNDSQTENEVGENSQQIEIEENSENVGSLYEGVNDENYNVEFEYADSNVSDHYVDIFVKINNKSETAICITSQRYFYLNDVSIERALVKIDEEIPSGKSALFEITFEREKIEAVGISTINSLTCQYDIAEKVDSKNVTSSEITLEGLGIKIN